MSLRMSRRQALTSGAAALVAGLGWPGGPAGAADDTAEQIAKFTGGKTPVAGTVRLDLPEIAENGNTVPLSVAVDGPLAAGVHVEQILILAPNNPQARVALFRFSLWSVPEASTRIRLGETQSVIAIARLSDGSFLSGTREIKVTIGGCGG